MPRLHHPPCECGALTDSVPGRIADRPDIAVHMLQWGKPIEGSARELLASAESEEPDERSATAEAQSWLIEVLSASPMKAADVQKEARQAGIADKPLRTARERLQIRPYRREFSGGWWWTLPRQDAQIPQDALVSCTGKQGILGAKGHLGPADTLPATMVVEV
jgi:putative DNA primase/helicase